MKQNLLALVLLILGWPVWAGRPLASDDAGTADSGTCQIESWVERAGSERAFVVAPACGVAPGWELGADYSRLQPRDTVRAAGGLALKWVPAAAELSTPAGPLSLGLKLSGAWMQPAQSGWQRSQSGLAALASLQLDPAWAMHLNLGLARQQGSRASLLNLALVWTPTEQALLFAEVQANTKAAVFGGALRTVGARWWLLKDRLGLDLTAGREAGVHGATAWTLGLGWYGIAW